MHLQQPAYLLLLLILPLLAWGNTDRRGVNAFMPFSVLSHIREHIPRYPLYGTAFIKGLRYAAIISIIIALARPQSTTQFESEEVEGIDIMLALDVSSSMLAEDFRPNRITAAKEVIRDFIQHRKNDRIGLVVFSGESYTQCPLTTDYGIIGQFLDDIHVGMITDGTAIGMAIATGLSRLKDSKARSRVLILLTDGENNSGRIDPLTAAKMAQTINVKIYTIGVGKRGGAPIPVVLPDGRKVYARSMNGRLQLTQMDEKALGEISKIAGGKFFRATRKKELKKIYEDIDRLEKNLIMRHSWKRYREYFPYWILAAVIFLSMEMGFRFTIARTLP